MMKKPFFGIICLLFLMGCAAPKKIDQIAFYPALPQEPRLQFLTSISTEQDIGKKQSEFSVFLLGELPDEKTLARPYDIGAVKGKIYISDRTYRKILIIDIENKVFDFIKPSKFGSLNEPAGLWITEDGLKYVTDFKRKQVLVFDENDDFLRAYGEIDQFDRPLDVAVYEDKIYVCDFNKHQILVLDKDSGETIQRIGTEAGPKEGQFFKPSHITVDKQGNLFVNDSFNFRIQKFNPQGEFIKVFGYHGDTLGGFARPKGLAIDRDGYLYAVDTAFENVQIFDDETADILLFFGGFGSAPGSMYLPNGIHIDYENLEFFEKYADKDFKLKYLVYVGNMLGKNKLNVYGFGEWTGEPLPGM
jgi:DNA-binding beta-propeller fold protein YncE